MLKPLTDAVDVSPGGGQRGSGLDTLDGKGGVGFNLAACLLLARPGATSALRSEYGQNLIELLVSGKVGR